MRTDSFQHSRPLTLALSHDSAPMGRPLRIMMLSLAAGVLLALSLNTQAADNSSASAAALKVLLGPAGDFQQMGNAPPTGTLQAMAAKSGQASAATPAGRATVTVQRGETLDRLIRRALPGMPLHPDFLRQAFVQVNPQVFPRGAAHAMRSGTTLLVPNADDLRQMLALQHPEFMALWARSEPAAQVENEPIDKRRWVRYP